MTDSPYASNMHRSCIVLAVVSVLACKSNPEQTTTGASPAATTNAPAPPVAPVSSAVARVQVAISMRTSDHLAVLRDAFDGKADAAAVRAFFEPSAAGDAPAATQFDTIGKLAKDGWKVQRFEVRTIKVDDDLKRATAEVFEWLVKNDASQCRRYQLPWTLQQDVAYRGAAFDVRDATCPTLVK